MKQYLRVALCALLLGACGGSDEPAEEVQRTSTSGSERRAPVDDGVAVTGLMGTIRQDEVVNALSPRMPRFVRCFSQRMGDVELLGGDIRLSFRIHTDGSVAWVYPLETDIGDRDTERCVLSVASQTRFPRPRGGEAEFQWGFGLDPSEDIRPPLNWQADALGRRADDVATLGRSCRASGTYVITAYINPGGEVLAAGGTMPDQDSEAALDCILDAVRGMEMPDPGSYPAKITFQVR